MSRPAPWPDSRLGALLKHDAVHSTPLSQRLVIMLSSQVGCAAV